MIRILLVTVLFLFSVSPSRAQFRGQEPRVPSVAEGITQNGAVSGPGLFDLSKLEMRHSVSVSYGMSEDGGLGASMYVNSLRYHFSEPLTLRADIGVMFSPFGSAAQSLKSDLSGIFLKRASLDYAPSKDLRFSLQFRNEPYLSRYSGWNYGIGRGDDLFDDEDGIRP